MSSSIQEPRTVTELDHARIYNRLRRETQVDASGIVELIDTAELVRSQEVPANVVTMYSQVLVADLPTGQQRTFTLCYPEDAEPGTGFVSVLSPVGTALLGLTVGTVARWTAPDGTQAAAAVRAILFQPEASGDYLL